jgi:hypothetical protein
MRAPELHHALQGNPSLAKLKDRALRRIAEEQNTLVALADLVRTLTAVRPPDKYGEQYSLDDWVRLIDSRDFKAARLFLTSHGLCSPQGGANGPPR